MVGTGAYLMENGETKKKQKKKKKNGKTESDKN